MTIPRILSNKTVLTGLEVSSLKASSLFKPVFGDASLMGKVVGASPSTGLSPMAGGFKPDTGALINRIPLDSVGPNSVLKKFVR